jgi:DNA polymerase-3 subunit alpha
MAGQEKFVHLHVHSQYSTLDGANHLDRLVTRTRELGMDAIALTDHGNMFGTFAFQNACREGGIRPIFGCETYFSPTSHTDRTSSQARRNYHFLLLCENLEGYHNLSRLSSLGFINGFYYKPRIDLDLLKQYSSGLIATSTCLQGPICQALIDGRTKDAQKMTDDFVQVFGRGNFFIEIMDHGINEQKRVNEGLLEIARKNNLPLIATNDCHYLNEGDYKAHDVMLCIQMNKTLDDPNRMRFEKNEFYLKSPQAMIQLFGHLDGAIRNTVEIAERCRCEIPTRQKLLPAFKPPGDLDSGEYLGELVSERLKDRYGDGLCDTQIKRAEHELNVIRSMGFVDYFLIVWDFIDWAKKQKIPVGPGRGSGAGSIVAYGLGITALDPIEHGLLFERFLNPDRVSMPDFDIDFCYERRGEVIEYVKRKYGEDCVAQIITFGTMKARNSIRDVGRVMRIPLDKVNQVAKLVPAEPKMTLEAALNRSDELKEFCESDPEIKELIERARGVEGSIRQPGTHAAGIVICDRPLIDLIPLYKPTGQESMIATQYTMTEVEEVGLLKMDFLGLKNLTVIDRTLASINRRFRKELTPEDIPLEGDESTWSMLQAGKGLGVFQLESSGMRDLLVNFKPSRFSDLVALISLYRPGPMDNIPTFIRRKEGLEPIVYDHPDMEPILKETYGLFVYQEQVMEVARVLGGYTLGGADLLRRAMGKKKSEAMAREGIKFKEGAKERKIDEATAARVFETMNKFASYGFNKSHAAAYAVITVRTAWLKANYPVDFYSALLTNEIGGDDARLGSYFDEVRDMGIRILQPDINTSGMHFTPDGDDIRFGLSAIKGVGESAVEAILTERDGEGEGKGPFRSPQDFISRVDKRQVNSRTVEVMVKCGCFDEFGLNRPSLLDSLPKLMELAGVVRADQNSQQINLFTLMDKEQSAGLFQDEKIPVLPDWSDKERLETEKELVGFYLSGHPLERYKPDFAAFSTAPAVELLQLQDRRPVKWVGLIKRIVPRTDKNGKMFCFAECEDMSGAIEATFFADAFARSRECLKAGEVIWIRGRMDSWKGNKKVRVDEARPIDAVRADQIGAIEVRMPWQHVSEASLTRLREITARYPGRRHFRVCVHEEDHELRVQAGKGHGIQPGTPLIRDLQDDNHVKDVSFVVARSYHG